VSLRNLQQLIVDRLGSWRRPSSSAGVADRHWELIEPLIPPRPTPRGPGGRPRIDDRAALEGILFVLDTGCRWRDLPEQLGCGSGHTAWRRLREWHNAGVWDRLHQLVLDELSESHWV
jgi:transposase